MSKHTRSVRARDARDASSARFASPPIAGTTLVGLEHLLLRAHRRAAGARASWRRCGVDLDALRSRSRRGARPRRSRRCPAPKAVEPEPTLGFDRVVQQAVVHAAVVEREAGRQRQPARVPAAGGGEPRRVLPAQAGRRSADAAARDLARRRRPSRPARRPAATAARARRAIRSRPTPPISLRARPRGRSIR